MSMGMPCVKTEIFAVIIMSDKSYFTALVALGVNTQLDFYL